MQNTARIKKGPFLSKVIENVEISENVYQMTAESDEIARNSLPGQFVSPRCADLTLRRPLSISAVSGSTYELIYKVKGAGTKYLAGLKQGESMDIIGPMGNGFSLDRDNYLLIGCGVGIAPINFLIDALGKGNKTFKSIACFRSGYKTNRQYDYLITEDGSSDIQGRMDEHFNRIITEVSPEIICICGPNPAMQYVTTMALKNNIETEVALEGEMACGTGVCMGCAIKIIKNGSPETAKICGDGPVFRGEQVIWG